MMKLQGFKAEVIRDTVTESGSMVIDHTQVAIYNRGTVPVEVNGDVLYPNQALTLGDNDPRIRFDMTLNFAFQGQNGRLEVYKTYLIPAELTY